MEYRREGKFLVLLKEYTYRDVVIPPGFKWDGATIPQLLKKDIGDSQDERFTEASLVHDYLYIYNLKKRRRCDELFFTILLKEDTPSFKAILMFIAVRLFGWYGFWKNRKPLPSTT